jgi:hypothetical protein
MLAAVLAMSAITASAAAANEFHAAAAPTTLTVGSNETQKFLYESSGKTVECTAVAGAGGMQTQTKKEVVFEPQYSECTVNGISFSKAEVSMNGCAYQFTIEATKNEGQTHVNCFASKQITITVKVFGISVCTYHIGKQTPKGNADYVNNGSNSVNVQPTQTGIVATRQGGSDCGALQSQTGTYTGAVQIIGEKPGTQQLIDVQVG